MALYTVIFPVVGQLVAGFLPHHPMLDPFFATAMLQPVFPRAVNRTGRVAHILTAFIADLCQPLFERLGFWRGNGVDYS